MDPTTTDPGADNTAFGILTGDAANALTGGLLSGLNDAAAIAQVAGSTAVTVNTAVARANAPVTATPVTVNTVTGQTFSGFNLGGLTSNPMALVLILVIIVAVAHK